MVAFWGRRVGLDIRREGTEELHHHVGSFVRDAHSLQPYAQIVLQGPEFLQPGEVCPRRRLGDASQRDEDDPCRLAILVYPALQCHYTDGDVQSFFLPHPFKSL